MPKKIKNKTLKSSLLDTGKSGEKKTKIVKIAKKILGKKVAHVIARGQERRAVRKVEKARKKALRATSKGASKQKQAEKSTVPVSPKQIAPSAPNPKVAGKFPPTATIEHTPQASNNCGCSIDGKRSCRKCKKQEREQEGYQAYCSPPSSPRSMPLAVSSPGDRSVPPSHKQVAFDDFLSSADPERKCVPPSASSRTPPSTYEEDMEMMLAIKFAQAAKERKSNEKMPKAKGRGKSPGFFARLKAKRDRKKKEKSVTVKPTWVTPEKQKSQKSKKSLFARCMFPKRSPPSDDVTYLEETRSENSAAVVIPRRKKSADGPHGFKDQPKIIAKALNRAANRVSQKSLGASLHCNPEPETLGGVKTTARKTRASSDVDEAYRAFD